MKRSLIAILLSLVRWFLVSRGVKRFEYRRSAGITTEESLKQTQFPEPIGERLWHKEILIVLLNARE